MSQRSYQFLILFWHSLRLEWRQSSAALTTIAVYAIALFVFALIFSHESRDQSSLLFPIIALVLGVITVSHSHDKLFYEDHEDGTLELYISQNLSLEFYSLAKGLSHWFFTALPLVILFFLTAMLGSQSYVFVFVSSACFALTTMIVVFMGMVCSALILASKRGQGVIVVLLLPILIPSLLVSHACFSAASNDLEFSGYFAILLGLGLISGGISLCATPFALRLAIK